MTLIRVSMILDSSRFAKMLDLLGPEDALSIGIIEVNKPPPIATNRGPYKRPARKPKIKRKQTARDFILGFARNGPFNARKQLVPAGEYEGFHKRTLHFTCAQLAKQGVLKRTGPGDYEFNDLKPEAETAERID